MNAAEERVNKLAAMQSNASNLEEDRRRRVAETMAEDERQRAADDKMRSDRGRFVSGLHQQAGSISLGDNLRRRGVVASGI